MAPLIDCRTCQNNPKHQHNYPFGVRVHHRKNNIRITHDGDTVYAPHDKTLPAEDLLNTRWEPLLGAYYRHAAHYDIRRRVSPWARFFSIAYQVRLTHGPQWAEHTLQGLTDQTIRAMVEHGMPDPTYLWDPTDPAGALRNYVAAINTGGTPNYRYWGMWEQNTSSDKLTGTLYHTITPKTTPNTAPTTTLYQPHPTPLGDTNTPHPLFQAPAAREAPTRRFHTEPIPLPIEARTLAAEATTTLVDAGAFNPFTGNLTPPNPHCEDDAVRAAAGWYHTIHRFVYAQYTIKEEYTYHFGQTRELLEHLTEPYCGTGIVGGKRFDAAWFAAIFTATHHPGGEVRINPTAAGALLETTQKVGEWVSPGREGDLFLAGLRELAWQSVRQHQGFTWEDMTGIPPEYVTSIIKCDPRMFHLN